MSSTSLSQSQQTIENVDELFAEVRRMADGDQEVVDRMEQEFAENPEFFMAKFVKGMSTMLREESLDGNTGVLKVCMGEQLGGGAGPSLGVELSDCQNAELKEEWESIEGKLQKIKNDLRRKANGMTLKDNVGKYGSLYSNP